MQILHNAVNFFLFFSINEFSRSYPRDAADKVLSGIVLIPTLFMDSKKEGLIGHTGLQTAKLHDFALRNMENGRNQFHGFRTGAVIVFLIEGT